MPSPFPGMNPYVEVPVTWNGLHTRFLVYVADELVPQVDPAYEVHVERHLFLTDECEDDVREHFGQTDVALINPDPDYSTGTEVATISQPVVGYVRLGRRPIRPVYLKIVDSEGLRVVTVLELLSPVNKRPGNKKLKQGRQQYLDKRRKILRSSANLVEIDLLRGGVRPPVVGMSKCDYYVMVSRRAERPSVLLWPLQLRDRLPIIPVPLRDGSRDAVLDLQAIFHKTFDSFRYKDRIYQRSPDPPLTPAQLAWAKQFIPAGAVPP